MNHKRDLITDGPTLSIQACDDGVWLHFTTLDRKLHCSFNLPVKFAKGTYLFDSTICQWSKEFATKNQDAPQEASGTQPTDVQQLKAEIAALATRLEHYPDRDNNDLLLDIVDAMRQLSAI